MSPTSLVPGAAAVKSPLRRSGVAAAAASATVVCLYGRGWQATNSKARMIERTSSKPASMPSRANAACTR